MRKLLFLAFFSLSSMARAATVSFTTEDYPPFNYREGKEIKGATVDQVRKVMSDIGTDYTIELMPWARAYTLAQTTPMTCVFATAHNTGRDKLFKWIEPLLIDRNILIRRSGSDIAASTIEEAKQYTVGTWREDYTETILRQDGFPRIDVASDFRATLKKLISGRIDLMPISEVYFDRLKLDGVGVDKVVELSSQPMGIACQKDFPEDLRERMQAALTRLIANGDQKRIFLQYGLNLEN